MAKGASHMICRKCNEKVICSIFNNHLELCREALPSENHLIIKVNPCEIISSNRNEKLSHNLKVSLNIKFGSKEWQLIKQIKDILEFHKRMTNSFPKVNFPHKEIMTKENKKVE